MEVGWIGCGKYKPLKKLSHSFGVDGSELNPEVTIGRLSGATVGREGRHPHHKEFNPFGAK